ncbi:MAG: D-amino acid aminotransferase [Maricaulis sp.]|jgi:D-alanine transaminase|nr:D-amino acid aminotransferase [Maricaulis sp.]HAQ35353.1 D-amino acid aminotransferase [Alphaproteobacteria bacterium]
MSRIAYVNGAFLPHSDAAIHIEDRGNQFADAVYEVWAIRAGGLLDTEGHLKRLGRSLGELRIRKPMTDAALMAVLYETVRRNRVRDGLLYLQVSRGCAPRDHCFPGEHVGPTVIVTVKRTNTRAANEKAEKGVSVITIPDIRWGRRDIKTVSLLPNALAKQAAKEAGAAEAWLIDPDGTVTEGSSSNAWILTKENTLVTRAASQSILNGITRQAVIAAAQGDRITFEERAFTRDEALDAREAFITSASAHVTPVIRIDGQPVADGEVGPVALALRWSYLAAAHQNSAVPHKRQAGPLVARPAKRRIG